MCSSLSNFFFGCVYLVNYILLFSQTFLKLFFCCMCVPFFYLCRVLSKYLLSFNSVYLCDNKHIIHVYSNTIFFLTQVYIFFMEILRIYFFWSQSLLTSKLLVQVGPILVAIFITVQPIQIFMNILKLVEGIWHKSF